LSFWSYDVGRAAENALDELEVGLELEDEEGEPRSPDGLIAGN